MKITSKQHTIADLSVACFAVFWDDHDLIFTMFDTISLDETIPSQSSTQMSYVVGKTGACDAFEKDQKTEQGILISHLFTVQFFRCDSPFVLSVPHSSSVFPLIGSTNFVLYSLISFLCTFFFFLSLLLLLSFPSSSLHSHHSPLLLCSLFVHCFL